MNDYETVTAKCQNCGIQDRLILSIHADEKETFCYNCGQTTIWKRVEP